MLDGIDLTDPHALERVRRSVAMLQPGADVLKREESLQLIDQLLEELRAIDR